MPIQVRVLLTALILMIFSMVGCYCAEDESNTGYVFSAMVVVTLIAFVASAIACIWMA